MKSSLLAITSILAAISLSNCAAPAGPNTQRGIAGGALLGAAAGAIIGHQTGSAGQGAMIGAATGGTAGGLFGNAADQERSGRY
jgi:uncharacterized protein YcfJ